VQFILYLILFALTLAFVGGLVLRVWTFSLPPVLFAEVSPPYAAGIVSSFLEGVSETRFGFPSGVFRINPRKTIADSRITAAEMQPNYSVTDGCAAASTSAGAGVISGADGCVEILIAIFIFAFILGPIFALNLTEKMFRKLLESEVRADLEPVSNPDGTMVTIRLRGVNALLMRSAYQQALSQPTLPEDIAIASGVQAPAAATGTTTATEHQP
jgi:hypothetical protein